MNEQQRNAYHNFISQVVQIIAESGDNQQKIYSLLTDNLDKLDENLPSVLKEWSELFLLLLGANQANAIATCIAGFGDSILKFNLGNRANNIEIAIAAYNIAVPLLNSHEQPQLWAVILNNLGIAYFERIKGDRSSNLEQSIQCYQRVLQICVRENLTSDWARTQLNLGNAYLQQSEGNREENIEQSIQCYQAALQVYTRKAFPKLWADTQSNLGVAYKDRIQGGRSLNLEMAIAFTEAALQVHTQSAFPLNWAGNHNNLGNAYLERIVGKKADNLEYALAALQAALQIYTQQNFPEKWANTQINLGAVYSRRIEGKKAENLERAISHYKAALTTFTKEDFPQKWAIIQNNLGEAYNNRIRGEIDDNLEVTISCYQASLQVYTREAFPELWAQSQNNLGSVYLQRIKGDRADNIEQAIQYYKTVLQIRTRETLPWDWAMSQHNLGAAFFARIKGDPAENIEDAIQCYQAAMLVYTHEAMPQDWADTQLNLGNAYTARIVGEKAENLEQAILCYEAALRVHTREAFPQRWAQIQTNLGAVYVNRIEGDRAENLEQAIACCQVALQILTRDALPHFWATTQVNLGKAYSNRICGESSENIQAEFTCYQAALQVYTREAFPHDWALIMNNLGSVYTQLNKIDEALSYFRLALEIHTPIANPIECLRTGKNMGNAAFSAQRWTEAIEGYNLALKAIETSRSWMSAEARRQEILESEFIVNANLVQACVNCGQLDKAIEYAERSRCQRLVDIMLSNDLHCEAEISPQLNQYLQEYESLQKQINVYRQTKNSGNNRDSSIINTLTKNRAAITPDDETIQNLEIQKQQVWRQLRRLDPVLASQIQVNPPQLAAMQELIDHPAAIVSFYTTRDATHIFVLRQTKITCHSRNNLGAETFLNLIFESWLNPYLTDKEAWKNNLLSVLKEVTELLDVENLINQHLSGIEELIIIPHLFLHSIPFAALPIANGQYLGDKFLIRYIPNCQILEFCQKRPQLDEQLIYGTIEDATEDLPCSSFEGDRIAQLHKIPDYLRLKGSSEATVNNYRQLVKQVQVILNSHHAQSRLDDPLESKLILSDGSITLGQLLTPGWRLPQLVDVFLSCCETGLGLTSVTDDIFTLASGFLCAGARSVVSTLWAVDDLATALFSIFYHQYRQKGSCRPAALQQAQEELRSLSGETFATVYQPQINLLLDEKFQQLDKARKEAKANRDRYPKDTPDYLKWDEEYKHQFKAGDRIRQTKNRLKAMSQEAFPFSHPFYWAAFTCSGLR